MQTASGNESGHGATLIAVGLSAVADVCCRLSSPDRGSVSITRIDALALIHRLPVGSRYHRKFPNERSSTASQLLARRRGRMRQVAGCGGGGSSRRRRRACGDNADTTLTLVAYASEGGRSGVRRDAEGEGVAVTASYAVTWSLDGKPADVVNFSVEPTSPGWSRPTRWRRAGTPRHPVVVVREGNRDWDDLLQPGIEVMASR